MHILAKRTSRVRWDEWDDTALRIQNSKFKPWRIESEYATSWSRYIGLIHFCFFQTAETGKRIPNSSVKGSGANHYPRAPASPPPISATFRQLENNRESTKAKITALSAKANSTNCLHKVQNSRPWGLRPSTLPLGHGGSLQYWIVTSERERNILFLWNLKAKVGFKPFER